MLLKLSWELKYLPGVTAETGETQVKGALLALVKALDQSIDSIELQQLVNYLTAKKEEQFVFQIPVLLPEGTRTAELYIRSGSERGRKRGINPDDIHLIFLLTMQSLGDLRIDARLTEQKIRCTIEVGTPEGARFVKQHLNRLSDRLAHDDEKDIQELLTYNLTKEGFRVKTASNGREALSHAAKGVDLVVLDVMMPEMDVWEVCRSLRQNPATAALPIVFLTARDSDVDEVVGLELGADDHIVKPVRVRTFIARVKKALRRRQSSGAPDDPSVIEVGGVEIYPENYAVKIKGKDVALPKKEFEVLLCLVRHPDRVVSRDVLLNEVWGRDVVVVDRTIDVHIRKFREKIGPAANHIETVKGVGYRQFKKTL